jgi:hypothetical protein
MNTISNNQAGILDQLKTTAQNMSGWMKLLGIITIISGVLSVLSIVGIIVAWIPIWLGILLIQSASRANSAGSLNKPEELLLMLDKLRLYFVVQGIMLIVILAASIIGIVGLGFSLPFFIEELRSFQITQF